MIINRDAANAVAGVVSTTLYHPYMKLGTGT